MQAVIMAGGKGTRLREVNKDIPKPMFPVLGKPVLEYQIESLKNSGIRDIIIIVGYLGDVIIKYFNDGNKWDVNISYIHEEEPLGTAGSLVMLKDIIKDDFILLFGDVLLNIDFERFMTYHKSNDAEITLFGHPNSHPFDSDLLIVDDNGKVTGFDSKHNVRDYDYHNMVNAGVYCISQEIIEFICGKAFENNAASKETDIHLIKLDLEKDVINSLISGGRVNAYKSTEYVKDMGTPDRLSAVTEDVKRGLVSKRSLKKKQKAIFLDRDGTINVLKGFLKRHEDVELLPGVIDAVAKINQSEYLAIVITNQPVIARGECTFEELDRIHKRLETELGKGGAYYDDLFFCPHHPNKGFEGELPEYKIECDCRKPKIGMLSKAAEKYNIDLSQSWYIGDTTRDIQTGINAGIHTILVKTGEGGRDGKFDVEADYKADDLLDAVGIVLGE